MAVSVKKGTKVEGPLNSDQNYPNGDGSTTYVNAGSVLLTSEDGNTRHVVPPNVWESLFVESDDSPDVPKKASPPRA